eukprot:g1235.t1
MKVKEFPDSLEKLEELASSSMNDRYHNFTRAEMLERIKKLQLLGFSLYLYKENALSPALNNTMDAWQAKVVSRDHHQQQQQQQVPESETETETETDMEIAQRIKSDTDEDDDDDPLKDKPKLKYIQVLPFPQKTTDGLINWGNEQNDPLVIDSNVVDSIMTDPDFLPPTGRNPFRRTPLINWSIYSKSGSLHVDDDGEESLGETSEEEEEEEDDDENHTHTEIASFVDDSEIGMFDKVPQEAKKKALKVDKLRLKLDIQLGRCREIRKPEIIGPYVNELKEKGTMIKLMNAVDCLPQSRIFSPSLYGNEPAVDWLRFCEGNEDVDRKQMEIVLLPKEPVVLKEEEKGPRRLWIGRKSDKSIEITVKSVLNKMITKIEKNARRKKRNQRKIEKAKEKRKELLHKRDKFVTRTLHSVMNKMITQLEKEEARDVYIEKRISFVIKKIITEIEKEDARKRRERARKNAKIEKERVKLNLKINREVKQCLSRIVKQIEKNMVRENSARGKKISLLTGIETGVFVPGKEALSVHYRGHDFYADLTENGSIQWQGFTWQTPSGFAIHVKKMVNPAKKADAGWTSVFYRGKTVDDYREEIRRRLDGEEEDMVMEEGEKEEEEEEEEEEETNYFSSSSEKGEDSSFSSNLKIILTSVPKWKVIEIRNEENKSSKKRQRNEGMKERRKLSKKRKK